MLYRVQSLTLSHTLLYLRLALFKFTTDGRVTLTCVTHNKILYDTKNILELLLEKN